MFRFASLILSLVALGGCGDDSSSVEEVSLYTTMPSCSDSDVHNCDFDKGVYVVALNSVSIEQSRRVETQVRDFLVNISDDAKQLFSQKTLLIGVIEDAPEGDDTDTNDDELVLSLAEDVQDGGVNVIDGVELVYTSNGVDETTQLTSYQKMIQLFDYYVDGNENHNAGSELSSAYNDFLFKSQSTSVNYNECNYGNGALSSGSCPANEDDGGTQGELDPIHTVGNLNAGALVGSLYEYVVNPGLNEVPDELEPYCESNCGTDTATLVEFSNSGVVASGSLSNNDWSNPAFKPLMDYIEKWLLPN
jgi:hypothetical protein